MGRGIRRDEMTKLSGTILDGESRLEGRGAGTAPRNTNLFVSAAVVAVLAVIAPTQVFAGHLGGGLGGGVGGGLGGGLGGIGGSMSGGANGAFNGTVNGNGLGRVDRSGGPCNVRSQASWVGARSSVRT